MNHAAEKIIGISREVAVGQKCFDVFQASICQNACALEKTIKTGKPIIDLPINVLNSKGKTIPVSISTSVLYNEKRKIVGGVETFRDLSAMEALRKEIKQQYALEDIISKNHDIQKIFSILPDIAESESTVLIQGPSGSGKELFAKAIHNLSPRKKGPFVAVNCGALPDNLLESELFGYVKGAFTDAKKDKPGRFTLADKGTMLLDEIGDLSIAMQVKLLRVLQEKKYEPLGSSISRKADVRIIAATNRPLEELIAQGRFRDDLYYRINVIKIELPSLSQRREDIPLLVDHFINAFNLRMGKQIIGVTDEVMNLLMNHDFPGNVRELENIIEHAFVLCKESRITVEHLPPEFIYKGQKKGPKESALSAKGFEDAEIRVIREALERNQGHRGKTAKELGINPSTLWRKMKKYELFSV